MNDFKQYLEIILEELSNKKTNLEKKLSEIPEYNIDIKKHTNLKQLRKEYTNKKRLSFIQKIFKPSIEDLTKYVKEILIANQQEEINDIKKQIKEITEIIDSIENNMLTTQLDSTHYIIRELLNYSLNFNISSAETNRLLIDILRKNKQNTSIEYKIIEGILDFYDSNNTLKENINYNSLKMIYSKLFLLTLTEEERIKFAIIINSILLEISPNKEKQEVLIKQKKALQQLQTYIKDGKVTAITDDIEKFNELLDKSGIEHEQKDNLIKQMQNLIETKNKEEYDTKTNETLKNYLSPTEMLYIEQSKIIENNYSDPVRKLISRLRNDVISSARYIDLIKDSLDIHDSLEILSKRIELLAEVLEKIQLKHHHHPHFKYLIDDDYVPYILRTLETKEPAELTSIQALLKKLTNNKLYALQINVPNTQINLYKIQNEHHTILYTKINSQIIVIDAYQNITLNENLLLTPKQKKKILEYMTQLSSPEISKLNSIYEELINSTLNVENQEVIHEYKKER